MEPDDSRRELFEAFERLLGAERARKFMAQIRPFPWEELATKRDLEKLATKRDLDELRAQMVTKDELRSELGVVHAKFGELRGEFGELRGEFGKLRGDVGSLGREIAGLDQNLRERFDFTQLLAHQTRTMVIGMVGAVAAIVTVAIVLATLG